MSRYLLVPADGKGESTSISIPAGLVGNDLFTTLQEHVKDKNRLQWLLTEFSRHGISESDEGLVNFKNKDCVV